MIRDEQGRLEPVGGGEVLTAYVREPGAGRPRWTRVGEAVRRADGTVLVQLSALPIGGRLVLRPAERRANGQTRGA